MVLMKQRLILVQTVIAGGIAFLGLPDSQATAKYLTEEEREWAMKRLAGSEDDRFK